ncbi:potassium/sodium hyperpolarization-activated cyclic nucleotide-gated channel 1-like [Anticarsia gemmatalis]|uniref:potassium/sodium hyperpolarization-activated cyclic nucleotide-gated channel 1-like n=1 Tax=Anticarsia gemmatalis TaxID=129554 RepID=UPI003F76D8CF
MYNSKEYRGFHESYYAHACPIIPEKDVLYTDITGNDCFSHIRRWWNDLFLLSSTNERSRGFYNSSHAMRIERFRQFRKYKSRIHPMSKFRNSWDCMMLLVFVVNKIIFRFTSTIIFEKIHITFYYLGAFLEIVIALDFYVNLKTGYIDNELKKVVLDTKKSLIKFCSTKLFIHLVSALPLHWFMFMRYGTEVTCGLCKANKFMCSLKLLSVFSLYRVVELSVYYTWKRTSPMKVHVFKFLRIGVVGLMTMFQFYDIVDVIWILSALKNARIDPKSFIGLLIYIRYGTIKNVSNYVCLCFDLSRIFKSLLLFSFGVKHSLSPLDKASSVIAYIIANFFYGWSLLECLALVNRLVYPEDKMLATKNSVLNLLVSRQLSDELKPKVEQYVDFRPTKLRILEQGNGLYKSLPVGLKKQIALAIFLKLIMRVPLFKDWPMPILEDLALMLKSEVYLRNSIVSEAATSGKGMMIVDLGVLAVYSVYHEEVGHLIDGDHFGELSLVTDRESNMSYVIAVTPCRMLILEKVAFRTYMRQHPGLFYEFKTKLEQRHDTMMERNELETIMSTPYEVPYESRDTFRQTFNRD